MKIFVGRISGFKTGDRVVLKEDINDLSWGRPVPAGLTGRLGRFYRVQDGVECWQVWLDDKSCRETAGKMLVCCGHTQIERLE